MALSLRLSTATGATVAGVVNLVATPSSVLSSVRFILDGTQASEDIGYPWQWSWDTRSLSDGAHTVIVQAIHGGRVVASRAITVTVDNVAPGGPTTTNAAFDLVGLGTLTVAPTITQGTVSQVFPGSSVFPSDNAPTTVSSRALLVHFAELEVPGATTDRRLVVYQAELEVPA